MKHIEVSKKIELKRETTPGEIRDELIRRLEKTIEIETLTEGDNEFSITGTTGSPASVTRYARLDLNISMDVENNIARFLISGYARTAKSLVLLYMFLFCTILLVGLLPGFIETHENSGAIDALFFLILGIFIIYDVNKKLDEPKEGLETALESLNTVFG